MDIKKLRNLHNQLDMAATNAELRAKGARDADNVQESAEWNGLHNQYQKWADMLAEATKE